ncbi:hypothetical protein S83_004738, partial [Arachis hypogaea]
AAILGITLGGLVILLMILLVACQPYNLSFSGWITQQTSDSSYEYGTSCVRGYHRMTENLSE